MNFDRLAEFRVKAKLTTGQVAKKLGVSRTTVYKWETGFLVPNAEHLRGLCKLYGIDWEVFDR